MQHFCHHGDTICHPNSSCITTNLYGTSAFGCNNNATMPKQLFSRFQPSTYARQVDQSGVKNRLRMPPWQDDDTVEFMFFRVFFVCA